GATVSHAVCRVRDKKRWYAQALHAFHVSGAAIAKMSQRHLPLWSVRHAISVQKRQLLIERHLLQHQVGALFGAELGIHPRSFRSLGNHESCRKDDDGWDE